MATDFVFVVVVVGAAAAVVVVVSRALVAVCDETIVV